MISTRSCVRHRFSSSAYHFDWVGWCKCFDWL